MLKILLDEHLSPDIAEALCKQQISAVSLGSFNNGELLGADDEEILNVCLKQQLVLVTYDRRTIPPVIKNWAESGHPFPGIIFVDNNTIRPSDKKSLIRALAKLYNEMKNIDWRSRVVFLRRG